MTQDYPEPIAPSPELVQQWARAQALGIVPVHSLLDFAEKAAQWGADTELEACCEWLGCGWKDIEPVDKLRSARRPKPPSLKEQALAELAVLETAGACCALNIRLALEQLDD